MFSIAYVSSLNEMSHMCKLENIELSISLDAISQYTRQLMFALLLGNPSGSLSISSIPPQNMAYNARVNVDLQMANHMNKSFAMRRS